MHNDMLTAPWSVMYQEPQFRAVARKRKLVVIPLFVMSVLFYFSIPFITTFYPQIFHVQLFGAVNIGLVYAVLQYPLGGLVACAYAVHMRKLDQEVTRL